MEEGQEVVGAPAHLLVPQMVDEDVLDGDELVAHTHLCELCVGHVEQLPHALAAVLPVGEREPEARRRLPQPHAHHLLRRELRRRGLLVQLPLGRRRAVAVLVGEHREGGGDRWRVRAADERTRRALG